MLSVCITSTPTPVTVSPSPALTPTLLLSVVYGCLLDAQQALLAANHAAARREIGAALVLIEDWKQRS